jgi:hypothetical protein
VTPTLLRRSIFANLNAACTRSTTMARESEV